ncbi:DUF1707 domain-containing protein [Dactylosporangium sp. NPDC000521]|uniref:DUF1707 SHOCT-like domain-containing protein n=1 Tax=Dactylosporangium sp. NPDC000521 TaxID=3363975 RepID=UPI0036BB0888
MSAPDEARRHAPAMRASDEDRRRVIDALQQHTQAGRLTLDEFADRCDTVLAAKTLADLRAATHDLPALPPVPAPAPADTSNDRHVLWVFAIALIAAVLLGVVYAAFH